MSATGDTGSAVVEQAVVDLGGGDRSSEFVSFPECRCISICIEG